MIERLGPPDVVYEFQGNLGRAYRPGKESGLPPWQIRERRLLYAGTDRSVIFRGDVVVEVRGLSAEERDLVRRLPR